MLIDSFEVLIRARFQAAAQIPVKYIYRRFRSSVKPIEQLSRNSVERALTEFHQRRDGNLFIVEMMARRVVKFSWRYVHEFQW